MSFIEPRANKFPPKIPTTQQRTVDRGLSTDYFFPNPSAAGDASISRKECSTKAWPVFSPKLVRLTYS
jgi:hypothetical protein